MIIFELIKLGIKYIKRIQHNASYRKKGVYIHPFSRLGSATQIGYGTKMNGPSFIVSTEQAPVSIGKYCAIGYNLKIINRNHKTGYLNIQGQFQRLNNFPDINNSIKGPLTIGNNVWIGDNVIILSGVSVGNGAVIGAGSVVTKNIPPFAVAVGNPAKIIKKRFSEEIIEELIKIEWWNWTHQDIKRNRFLFEVNFQDLTLPQAMQVLAKIKYNN